METMRSILTKSLIIFPLLGLSWIEAYPSFITEKSMDRTAWEFPPLMVLKSDSFFLVKLPSTGLDSTPKTCISVNPDLPDCVHGRLEDFTRDRSISFDKSTTKHDRNKRLIRSKNENIAGEFHRDDEKMIVYHLKGCRPQKFPSNLPLCDKNTEKNAHVEEYDIYPFWPKESLLKAPYVFPRSDSKDYVRPKNID